MSKIKTIDNSTARSSTIRKNNYYRDFFFKIIRQPSFIVPVILLVTIFIAGFIANMHLSQDQYMTVDFDKAFIYPNINYPFGTNEFGQNVFYQVLIGTYNTIKLAFVASLINLIIGCFIGILWGHNHKIDNLMIFIRNIFNNIPLTIFYLIIITAVGSGFWPMILVICLLGWVDIACLIRNNLIIIRNKDYNIYSKLNNVPTFNIAIHNYLPTLLPVVFNSFAISIPEMTSIEITLSYFGFSLGKGNIGLGTILYSALSNNICFLYPYLFIIPFIFTFTINVCFYCIGKTISDVSIKEDHICLK